MTSLMIASDPADAEAMDAVENHHTQMSGELALLVANLVTAPAGGDATSAQDRLVAMVDEVERAATHMGAASSGRALQALFAVHLDKENDQLLPLLAASADHSVAGMLAGMHEVLGGDH